MIEIPILQNRKNVRASERASARASEQAEWFDDDIGFGISTHIDSDVGSSILGNDAEGEMGSRKKRAKFNLRKTNHFFLFSLPIRNLLSQA